MADARNLAFTAFAPDADGVLVLFCDDKLEFGRAAQRILGTARNLVTRAAQAEKFTGKNGTLDLVMPAGLRGVQRLVVVGAGKTADIKPRDYIRLGGVAAGKFPVTASAATLVADLPGVAVDPERAADLAMGATLRRYRFDRYKTKRKEGEEKPADTAIRIQVADPAAARGAWRRREGLAKGVMLARDLINEPANVLHPEEFARRAQALRRLGVAVQVLGEREMRRLGMHALLGVGQGSERESQVVIMRWNGGRKSDAPVAFVGKGVCFDTGGISIKPAGGMEDMKGDMGGAACVVGLMQALATRKAKANVVGAIGLVENMPDGRAQRPGDIVKTMSGQTIEIINTDAEGRLVLADVLHFVATRYNPKFIVDLATLTGAIMVSLGHEYAGLFANDDTLAQRLIEAGTETGERVWRMPLGPEYDRLIDSRFADMKNTGGRNGGAITAAQLLQRFVGRTPWAHLDIAGTAFGAPADDINKGWSAGWGVRLLDRLVHNSYESAKGNARR